MEIAEGTLLDPRYISRVLSFVCTVVVEDDGGTSGDVEGFLSTVHREVDMCADYLSGF